MPQTTNLDKPREIAALIARLLSHFWTANEPIAIRRAIAEDWLDDLREFDADVVAAACQTWRRQPGGRRPTPGDIRTLCIAEQNQRTERKAIADQRAERWPKWLEDTWGSEPDGPRRRAEALTRMI